MKTKPSIGDELKQARETCNFTLRDVERATSISNAYLSQLENNKIGKPSANVLYKLANLYKIDFGHLLMTANIIEPGSKKEEKKLNNISSKTSDRPRTHTLAGHSLYSQGALTEEEEKLLVDFLQFHRSRSKKDGK